MVWYMLALLSSGAVLAVTLIGSPNNLLTTRYGHTFLFKMMGVLGLLMLGAWNKFRLVPSLKTNPSFAKKRLNQSITLECCLVLGVLGWTAWLTSAVLLPN